MSLRTIKALLEGKRLPPAPTKVATFEDWKHAVALAHAFLCRGENGATVGQETWLDALARISGRLLEDHGFGAPKGGAPAEWLRFIEDVARRPSTASDGCVARSTGLRVPLSAWPRGVPLLS